MASLVVTDDIRRVLQSAAASSSGVGQDVRDMASACSTTQTVPWSTLKAVVQGLRRSNPQQHGGLQLVQLCRGSSLQLPSPPVRVKHPDLVARNAKLQERLDNMRYAAMVADVTEEERAAEDRKDALLPSSRLQIGFGVQVLVTMGTFFALAYVGMKYYLHFDELWSGLAGALGMTFGLLLETALLIVRTNMPRPLHERYPHLFPELKKKKHMPPKIAGVPIVGEAAESSQGQIESKKRR